jgi:phosphoribosylamine--glycine ligase
MGISALVIGSGAREHALAWRLGQEGVAVTAAPGNGGTPRRAPISVSDSDALSAFAAEQRFDLTIVGPEAPLAAGIVDVFQARGLSVFGPTQAAARLESSKAWAKEFFVRHAIPTAHAEIVDSPAAARRAIARMGLPVAVKADGLAAGKGVWIVNSEAEIADALDGCERLGAAGSLILIEECLVGPELSVLAFADGERLAVMPPARDYKRLGDGDRGPNTGGMGGQTWPSYATPALLDYVKSNVLQDALDGLAAEGTPYRGVLYAGLMLTDAGPRVLEFNCRFGDPECELILPLLESSLVETCQSVIDGRLDPESVRWRPGQTFGVVLAAHGYPAAPRRGDPITGLDALPDGVLAFHAATAVESDQLVTSGGRVLTLVGESRADVYSAAESVHFAGKQYRSDIGLEAAVAAR